jgi:hypothetical protein
MTVRTKTTTSTRTAKTMRTLTIIHFYFQVPQLPDADASLESVDLSEDDRGQAGLEAFLAEVKRKKVIYVNFLKVKKIKYYFQQQVLSFLSFFSFQDSSNYDVSPFPKDDCLPQQVKVSLQTLRWKK